MSNNPLDALADLENFLANSVSSLEEAVQILPSISADDLTLSPKANKIIGENKQSMIDQFLLMNPTVNVTDLEFCYRKCKDGTVAFWIEKKGTRP